MNEQTEPPTVPEWDPSQLYRSPPKEELEYMLMLGMVPLDHVHPFIPCPFGNGGYRTHVMVQGLYFKMLIIQGDTLWKFLHQTLDAGKVPVIYTLSHGSFYGEPLNDAEAVERFMASNPNREPSVPVYHVPEFSPEVLEDFARQRSAQETYAETHGERIV